MPATLADPQPKLLMLVHLTLMMTKEEVES